MKSAIVFGVMYAVVLLAVAAAEHFFGDRGIFVVAGISGLTDMDAITLSTARMSTTGDIHPSVAWRAIIIGTIANMMFKAGIVSVLGGRRLGSRMAILYGLSMATGLLLLALWW